MNFKRFKHLHFVGIGGVGMCGIAEILLNLGYKISGSDLKPSETTEHLAKLGAQIFTGHKESNVAGSDVVVTSSAVKDENPEVKAAKQNKIPVIRRAEMLAELMRMKFGIAIAGTHGKTTTTSMIGQILAEGGVDPTIIVGGRVLNLESNAKLGKGVYLVAEADEFDRSFLKLSPTIAVVTNLEAEHLDCYKNLDEIKTAFLEFMNKVPFYGNVILCLNEGSLQSLMPQIQRPIITYGTLPQADIEAYDIEFHENSSKFKVKVQGKEKGNINLQVPGIHNVKNSLAALAVGLELEIPWEKIKKALQEFKGVNRRFEIKGVKDGIMVVDDYAHHPTEIEATLQAAKTGWDRRIIAIFQPHLYSRTKDFYPEFGKAFSNSDILIVTDIYPAREEPIPGVSGELVAQAAKKSGHKQVFYVPKTTEVATFLKKFLKKEDLVITLGAGDIYKVGQELLNNI